MDEPAFEERLDHAHQGVVDDAISERRRLDVALLGLEHAELTRAARLPAAPGEVVVQAEQVFFQVGGELGHLGPVALAAAGVEICRPQVVEAGDLLEEVVVCSGHDVGEPVAAFAQPGATGRHRRLIFVADDSRQDGRPEGVALSGRP